MISVIIPTYQHAEALSECLDSVLAQTFKDVEIIVVDDGSTDNTQDVLRPYQGRVKILKQENQGSNPARMAGYELSRGEELLFCDADVILKPDALEKLHAALEAHSDKSYAYSAFRFGWKTFRGITFDAKRLKQHNFVHTTSLVRRADFPGFDPAIKRLQDWDVWLTMLGQGKTAVLVPEVLFDVRIDGDSRIGSSWLPSHLYKLPWPVFGWMPKAVRSYREAHAVIAKKHGL